MESQTRNGNNETELDPGFILKRPDRSVLLGYILRSVAFLFAFVSALVLGAAKGTVILSNSTMRSGGVRSTQFPAYV